MTWGETFARDILYSHSWTGLTPHEHTDTYNTAGASIKAQWIAMNDVTLSFICV